MFYVRASQVTHGYSEMQRLMSHWWWTAKSCFFPSQQWVEILHLSISLYRVSFARWLMKIWPIMILCIIMMQCVIQLFHCRLCLRGLWLAVHSKWNHVWCIMKGCQTAVDYGAVNNTNFHFYCYFLIMFARINEPNKLNVKLINFCLGIFFVELYYKTVFIWLLHLLLNLFHMSSFLKFK